MLLCIAMLVPYIGTSFAWLGGTSEIEAGVEASVLSRYFESGTGTEENPFIIHTPRHLYNLAWLQYMGMFNEEDEDSAGNVKQYYFELCDGDNEWADDNDDDGIAKDGNGDRVLDMDGWTLPPIGTAEHPFVGNFNGNAVTIKNLTVSNDYTALTDVADTAGNFASSALRGDNTGCDIMGLFGAIGAVNSDTLGSLDYETETNVVSNFTVDNITVNSTTDSVLAGIVAGYVNGTVSGVGVIESTVTLASGTEELNHDDFTQNMSDYTTIGFCEEEYRGKLHIVTYDIADPTVEIKESIEGDDEGDQWGGSIAMDTLFHRLESMYNTPATEAMVAEVLEITKTVYEDGTEEIYQEIIERTASELGYNGPDIVNYSSPNGGSATFYDEGGSYKDTKEFIMLYSGTILGNYNPGMKVYVQDYYALDEYWITDGTHWLTLETRTNVVTDTDFTTYTDIEHVISSADGPEALRWRFEDAAGEAQPIETDTDVTGYLGTRIGEAVWYIDLSGRDLVVSTDTNIQWTYSNGYVYYDDGNEKYYLAYSDGWTVVSESDMGGFVITDGDGNYLSLDGSRIVNETSSENASGWTIERTSDYRYYLKSGNYYLRILNGALSATTNPNSSKTLWEMVPVDYESTWYNVYQGNSLSGYECLEYDEDDGWIVSAGDSVTFYRFKATVGNTTYFLNVDSTGHVVATDVNNTNWLLTDNGKLYTQKNSTTYYLTTSGNSITVTTTEPSTTWSISNGSLRLGTSGSTYAKLREASLEWKVMDENSAEYSYVFSSNGYYLRVNQGELQSSTTNDTTWYLDSAGRLYCTKNGTTYYLVKNGKRPGITTTVSDASVWTINANNRLVTTESSTQYYLKLRSLSNEWYVVEADYTEYRYRFYYSSNGTTYRLGVNNSGSIENNTTTYWYIGDDGSVYTDRNNTRYYLSYSGNDAAVTTTNPSIVWSIDNNTLKTGDNRLLRYDPYNNVWKVATTDVRQAYYTFSYNNRYLRVFTRDGDVVVDSSTTNDTRWFLGADGSLSTTYNGTTYYLSYSDSLPTISTTKPATVWTISNGTLKTGNLTLKYQPQIGAWFITSETSQTLYRISFVNGFGNTRYLTHEGADASDDPEYWFYDSNRRLYTIYNGIRYYLVGNGNNSAVTTTHTESSGTQWSRNTSGFYYTSGNSYYLSRRLRGLTYYWYTQRNQSCTVEEITGSYNNGTANTNYLDYVNASLDRSTVSYSDASAARTAVPYADSSYEFEVLMLQYPEVLISMKTDISPASIATYQTDETMLDIRYQTTEDVILSWNTPYTYLPLAAQLTEGDLPFSGYAAKPVNTGYITGGTHDSRGDLRVSFYLFNNGGSYDLTTAFNNATTYSSSRMEVLTKTYKTGGALQRISDGDIELPNNATNNSSNTSVNTRLTGYTKTAYDDLGLTKYANSRKQLHAVFVNNADEENWPTCYQWNNGSYSRAVTKESWYGIHYVNAPISASKIIKANYAMINGVEYTDYELPEDAIDCNLDRRGFINYFASSSYGNTDSFLSLHQVFRDENEHITAIKHIEKIYGHFVSGELDSSKDFIYLYEDGTYSVPSEEMPTISNYSGSLTGWAVAYDTDWSEIPGGRLASQNGGTSPIVQNALYYMEIPVNAGEYALGSVDGGNGGYLLYLDISTTSEIVRTTRTTEFYTMTDAVYEYPKGIQVIEDQSDVKTTVSGKDINEIDETDSAAFAITTAGTEEVGRVNDSISVTSMNRGYPSFIGSGITLGDGTNEATSDDVTPVSYTTVAVKKITDVNYDVLYGDVTTKVTVITTTTVFDGTNSTSTTEVKYYVDGVEQQNAPTDYDNDRTPGPLVTRLSYSYTGTAPDVEIEAVPTELVDSTTTPPTFVIDQRAFIDQTSFLDVTDDEYIDTYDVTVTSDTAIEIRAVKKLARYTVYVNERPTGGLQTNTPTTISVAAS